MEKIKIKHEGAAGNVTPETHKLHTENTALHKPYETKSSH